VKEKKEKPFMLKPCDVVSEASAKAHTTQSHKPEFLLVLSEADINAFRRLADSGSLHERLAKLCGLVVKAATKAPKGTV